ncbi:nucleoid-associated protein YgaU [Geodermatophilus bullaregiensis]|uniref:LysM peptidoglycan-binding domain-containing protein n=1 Tax=Geodermatophilus bullaregiensis TaxID=1564160 RepID=UPI0019589A29|nr:LysM peptidoglycan-binding domain-containing protein [Geodermatophilus bullaregiensis]MBM7805373.1 nucleoid-associated protein YgaU [Geodermatophilus bullaregiensis]
MGSVRQDVLQFDATVQVPWRPLLGAGAGGGAAAPDRPAWPVERAALPGSGPRVAAHLRPVPDRPATAEARTGGAGAGPSAEAPRTRRDPARPSGRPLRSRTTAGAVRGGCAPAPSAVRLTRRGRRLLTALALGAAVALGSWVSPLLPGGDGGLRLAGESSVVVEPGDTVWSIAGEVTGDGQDVRVVVDAIEELNDLEDSVVVPGQVLQLP